ncbi:response regulator transcription factor [Paenibacillus sp. FA6]|uniref:response regulator transcription factor n=1 Tax=Paenibacillus sp. FA6 TaxID=3413029 RepID=UPI003F65C88F
MWKLLIADDEPKIRRGLMKILPWNDLNIDIVGEAENGIIALELAKKLQPDILFVDVCMPFLDGLEFIAQLQGVLDRCVIIVISGHDEFNYAQKAIKLNVFEYLLKPVMKNKLLPVVENAIQALEEAHQNNERNNWVDSQLNTNSIVIRDTFLLKWIGGLLSEEEITLNLAFFNLNFTNPIGMVVFRVIQSLDTGKSSRTWNRDLLEFAVKNVAEDTLRNESFNILFKDQNGFIVIMSSIENDSDWQSLTGKIQNKIELLFEKIIIHEQRKIEGSLTQASTVYNELVTEVNTKGSLSPIVILTKKMMDHNYHNPNLSLKEVSDRVQVSPTYLSKQLKKELGVSFIDYLAELRIKKAMQLMNDPSAKIYEIAEMVGYSSQHYFSNAFKKITGVSPLLFKKGIRQ